MRIYYFQFGQRKTLHATDLTDAANQKYALRKKYGIDFSGCGHFHYFDEDGERHWL